MGLHSQHAVRGYYCAKEEFRVHFYIKILARLECNLTPTANYIYVLD